MKRPSLKDGVTIVTNGSAKTTVAGGTGDAQGCSVWRVDTCLTDAFKFSGNAGGSF